MAHLPEDDLPSSFDVVVDGTGLVQSIVAAALARVGRSVLHIDRSTYYGELWASLMHRELEQWVAELVHPSSMESSCLVLESESGGVPPPDEDWVCIKPTLPSVSNVQQVVPEWPLPQPAEPEVIDNDQGPPLLLNSSAPNDPQLNSLQLPSDVSEVSREEAERQSGVVSEETVRENEGESVVSEVEIDESTRPEVSVSTTHHLNWSSMERMKRQLNFDIIPKVMYCRGSLIDLLAKSNCGRYIEFKALSKIFSSVNGDLELVPCSRADMFTTKSLSMIDKRKMMRFLSFCAEYDSHPEQYQEFEELAFAEFLSKHDLSMNLRQYVIHCIAMVEETTPTIQALKATKLFLTSLGRFGNAPFLYPLYGIGELAQAFCRLSAVFGGVYCLRRNVQTLIVSSLSHDVKAIVCSTGQKISCSAAVCSVSNLTSTFQLGDALRTCRISRAIFVTDGPIANTEGSLSLITLPPCAIETTQTTSIRLIQLDPSTHSAVHGTYIIHAMCPSIGSSAEIDLQALVSSYFSTPESGEEGDKPRLLYSLYFNVTLNSFHHDITTPIDGIPRNVFLTSDPPSTMTFEGAVDEAKLIFDQICPGEEFLPVPPDPSDIVYDDPQSTQPPNSGEETDCLQQGGDERCGNQQMNVAVNPGDTTDPGNTTNTSDDTVQAND